MEIFCKGLNLYHTFPTFKNLVNEAFWKYCGEREKEEMLVTSIFFFAHNVFYQ